MFELKARLQVRSTLVHCVVQVQGKILDTIFAFDLKTSDDSNSSVYNIYITS